MWHCKEVSWVLGTAWQVRDWGVLGERATYQQRYTTDDVTLTVYFATGHRPECDSMLVVVKVGRGFLFSEAPNARIAADGLFAGCL